MRYAGGQTDVPAEEFRQDDGIAEGRVEAVRMMLAAGIPVETIAGALGIGVEECEGYRNMQKE